VFWSFPPSIFLVFFVNSLQQQIGGNLTAYVTSEFEAHPLLATTSVMSSIIGAVAKLPIAKIIDIWGRTEGYILMVIFSTVGTFWLVFQGLIVFIVDPARTHHDGRLQ
jgi:hypothetical protein